MAGKNGNNKTTFDFNSRRSMVLTTKGMVATSQPLAASAGMEILNKGGNAADAAIATAAALNVVEPCSTGIGGDCFCLYYDSKKKTVQALNGSGRCPEGLSIKSLKEKGYEGNSLPPFDVNTVTVPGSAAGWVDTVNEFGSNQLTMRQILEPAIDLAENGYPVSSVVSNFWRLEEKKLLEALNGEEMLLNGRAPKEGEIMKLPNLAKTFKKLASEGKRGFYEGEIAEAIVSTLKNAGGVMSLNDLKNHSSTFVNPIYTTYSNLKIWECPPNGQGLCVLIALNILSNFDFKTIERNSVQHFHLVIEALRLAFSDVRSFVCDPEFKKIPINDLLSESYAKKRAASINMKKASVDVKHGLPLQSSDTVYLTVVDKEGNACSFINSNFCSFGTGIVPKGCGFTLQNRGFNFSLNDNDWNCLEPNKRPYHTIIPGLVTDSEDNLWSSFGVMGGWMQPQGQVQVLLNMIHYDMNAQEALDSNRLCIPDGTGNGEVIVEEGLSSEVLTELIEMGHNVNQVSDLIPSEVESVYNRSTFGRGQIIRKVGKVLMGGSDPRADGQVCV